MPLLASLNDGGFAVFKRFSCLSVWEGSHYVTVVVWNLLYKPDRPQSHRDPPALLLSAGIKCVCPHSRLQELFYSTMGAFIVLKRMSCLPHRRRWKRHFLFLKVVPLTPRHDLTFLKTHSTRSASCSLLFALCTSLSYLPLPRCEAAHFARLGLLSRLWVWPV